MTPQFATPCYVRVDDKDKRNEVCDKLERIGYGLGQSYIDMLDNMIITYPEICNTFCTGSAGLFDEIDLKDRIDCGTNTELFLALAGMRSDTYNGQWFISLEPNGMWRQLGNETPTHRWRRATATEIVEHLKKKLNEHPKTQRTMKPTELRIGNIVTVNNPKYHPKLKDIPLLITGIYQRGGYIVNLEHVNQEPNIYYETYSQLIEYIEPIPLTEELLLKLEFERIDSGHAEEHEDYHQWLEKVYPALGCVYQGDGDYVFCEKFDDRKIYFLHELQNLYFAITGEELNVEL